MNDKQLGNMIVAEYGANGGIRATGPMVGYMAEPTVILEGQDGEQIHWAAHLCRLATHAEEVAYWKEQALYYRRAFEKEYPINMDSHRGQGNSSCQEKELNTTFVSMPTDKYVTKTGG